MTKICFLFTILTSVFIHAQNKLNDSITAATSLSLLNANLLYQDYNSASCYTNGDYIKGVDEDDILYIQGVFLCEEKYLNKKKYYLKVFYNDKIGYVEADKDNIMFYRQNKISVSDFLIKFTNLSEGDKESLKENGLFLSKYSYLKKKEGHLNYIRGYEKYGIALVKANAYEEYSLTGARFKILNTSKKTIKYITFNFFGENPVEDRVGKNMIRKGIGPVESYAYGSWDFDSVWLTDTVEYLNLISIQIQYMDGKIKTIPYNKNLWIDENKLYEVETMLSEN